MATATTRQELMDKVAARPVMAQWAGVASGTPTAPTATSNSAVQLFGAFNAIGTTLWSTLIDAQLPPVTNIRCVEWCTGSNRAVGQILVRANRIGTLDFTSNSGNRLTHDSTWTRLRRTVMGQANTAITMIPMVLVTTATATTAPILSFGTNGYVNQDGTQVSGAKTLTFPAAATALGSVFVMDVEPGDRGVLDVTDVRNTAASGSTAGAGILFGIELLSAHTTMTTSLGARRDAMTNGLQVPLLDAPSPDSGSVTSYLTTLSVASSTTTAGGALWATVDT